MQAKVFPEHIAGPQYGRHLADPFDDVSNPAVIASGAKQSPALGDCFVVSFIAMTNSAQTYIILEMGGSL
jgi:hypothetical protein